MLLNVSIIALLTIGQSIVILMRQIDLSISSIVGITAFLSGTIFVNYPETPTLIVIGASALLGLLLRRNQRRADRIGRIPALITTLGTLTSTAAPTKRRSTEGKSTLQTFRARSSDRHQCFWNSDSHLDRRGPLGPLLDQPTKVSSGR